MERKKLTNEGHFSDYNNHSANNSSVSQPDITRLVISAKSNNKTKATEKRRKPKTKVLTKVDNKNSKNSHEK